MPNPVLDGITAGASLAQKYKDNDRTRYQDRVRADQFDRDLSFRQETQAQNNAIRSRQTGVQESINQQNIDATAKTNDQAEADKHAEAYLSAVRNKDAKRAGEALTRLGKTSAGSQFANEAIAGGNRPIDGADRDPVTTVQVVDDAGNAHAGNAQGDMLTKDRVAGGTPATFNVFDENLVSAVGNSFSKGQAAQENFIDRQVSDLVQTPRADTAQVNTALATARTRLDGLGNAPAPTPAQRTAAPDLAVQQNQTSAGLDKVEETKKTTRIRDVNRKIESVMGTIKRNAPNSLNKGSTSNLSPAGDSHNEEYVNLLSDLAKDDPAQAKQLAQEFIKTNRISDRIANIDEHLESKGVGIFGGRGDLRVSLGVTADKLDAIANSTPTSVVPKVQNAKKLAELDRSPVGQKQILTETISMLEARAGSLSKRDEAELKAYKTNLKSMLKLGIKFNPGELTDMLNSGDPQMASRRLSLAKMNASSLKESQKIGKEIAKNNAKGISAYSKEVKDRNKDNPKALEAHGIFMDALASGGYLENEHSVQDIATLAQSYRPIALAMAFDRQIGTAPIDLAQISNMAISSGLAEEPDWADLESDEVKEYLSRMDQMHSSIQSFFPGQSTIAATSQVQGMISEFMTQKGWDKKKASQHVFEKMRNHQALGER